jgi:hypothetical protein
MPEIVQNRPDDTAITRHPLTNAIAAALMRQTRNRWPPPALPEALKAPNIAEAITASALGERRPGRRSIAAFRLSSQRMTMTGSRCRGTRGLKDSRARSGRASASVRPLRREPGALVGCWTRWVKSGMRQATSRSSTTGSRWTRLRLPEVGLVRIGATRSGSSPARFRGNRRRRPFGADRRADASLVVGSGSWSTLSSLTRWLLLDHLADR